MLEYHGRNSAVLVDRNSCRARAGASVVSFVGVNLLATFFAYLGERYIALITFVSFCFGFGYSSDTIGQTSYGASWFLRRI